MIEYQVIRVKKRKLRNQFKIGYNNQFKKDLLNFRFKIVNYKEKL